jgi:hypothetical protein
MPEAAHREAPPARACHLCGARQDERQEICVECGAAVPRARGMRARLRTAGRPLALAVFATLVVTSAAYGITAQAGRDSSAVKAAVAAAPPAATPPAATPQPPAQPAPAQPAPAPAPPAAAKPAAPAPKPAPVAPTPSPVPPPAPTPAPAAAAPPAPAAPSGGHSGGTSAGGGNSGNHSGNNSGTDAGSHARHHPRHHSHQPSWLSEGDQPYSASLFDPYANGVDEHGAEAPKTVDGSAGTWWTSGDHPGGSLGKKGVGLVVEASGFQSYSALGIQTRTPGMTVEVYSTDASNAPTAAPDQPNSGWKREAVKPNVAKQQRISLKGATADPHYLLVWITKLPAGQGRAGISEISLLP